MLNVFFPRTINSPDNTGTEKHSGGIRTEPFLWLHLINPDHKFHPPSPSLTMVHRIFVQSENVSTNSASRTEQRQFEKLPSQVLQIILRSVATIGYPDDPSVALGSRTITILFKIRSRSQSCAARQSENPRRRRPYGGKRWRNRLGVWTSHQQPMREILVEKHRRTGMKTEGKGQSSVEDVRTVDEGRGAVIRSIV